MLTVGLVWNAWRMSCARLVRCARHVSRRLNPSIFCSLGLRAQRLPRLCALQKIVDLGRWMVDLRLMSQKSKDEHEFGQVRALNHRGKPLPRLDARAIGAMQELEQMQRDDEQQVFRPCVFKIVYVYASYQVA